MTSLFLRVRGGIKPAAAKTLSFAFMLLLGACQSPPKQEVLREGWLSDPSVFASRLTERQGLESWKLTAKIGIKTPETRESANLVWLRNGEQNTLRLFGPLGVGAVKLEFNAQEAVLTDGRGNKVIGANAEQLLKEVTGWRIPVNALDDWMFAIPAQEAAFQYQLDEAQQMAALNQYGWEIEFGKYSVFSDISQPLPKRIVATNERLENEETVSARVRVIVKSWSFQ